MVKELLIAGFPRSGTTWMARMTADLFNAPLQDNPKNDPLIHFSRRISDEYIVRKTHHESITRRKSGYSGGGCQYVYINRDPRDVLVSIKYFKHFGSYYDAMGYMNDHNYTRFMMDWWAKGGDFNISYERLHESGAMSLYIMKKMLTGKSSMDDANEVYDRHKFDNWKDKYPGTMREGTLGQWKSVFDIYIGKEFERQFGQVMLNYGYTQHSDWWRELPDPNGILCVSCGINGHDGLVTHNGYLCWDCYEELESKAFHDGQRKGSGAPVRNINE